MVVVEHSAQSLSPPNSSRGSNFRLVRDDQVVRVSLAVTFAVIVRNKVLPSSIVGRISIKI